MKRLLICGVALAAIVAAAPALAADMRVAAPAYKAGPVVAPLSWSGCYAGLHGGYGWGDADDTDPVTVARNLSPDGYFAGGQLGCNWQWQPNWVFGIEGDIAGANINDEKQFFGGPDPFITHKIKSLASIRARAGWANGPHLWYLTGGWGWARAERVTAFTGGGGSGDADANHSGWVLGAGYEHMINQNWTVKLEYVYYDLGKETYNFGGFGPSNPAIDLDLHTVKFGVNYKW